MAKKSKAANRLTNLSVTVYPSYALVEGTYRLRLEKGLNRFELEGLPTNYDPDSLYIDSFSGPGKVTLGNTSYSPANLTPQAVQVKALNRKVTVRYGGNLESEQNEVSGKLLSLHGNVALLKVKGEFREVRNIVGFAYDELPEGLHNTPSLSVAVEAEKKGDYEVTLMYKALGFSWKAAYKWIYDEAKGEITWDGSVSLVNSSGATYPDAELSVVAGDAGEEDYSNMHARGGMRMAAMSMDAAPESVQSRGVRQAETESLGQVKVFTIPGRSNVDEGSQKVPFFVASGVPVTRENRVRSSHYWHARGTDRVEEQVRTILIFSNDEDNKLGTPLPGGHVAVMQRGANGRLRKSGGGRIDDAAVGEKVKLDSGTDFDLKAYRVIDRIEREEPETPPAPAESQEAESGETTSRRKREKKQRKVHYQKHCHVELFNGKKQPVQFVVEESLTDDCQFKGKHGLKQVSAGKYEATVTVEPGQTERLEYTIRQTVVEEQ